MAKASDATAIAVNPGVARRRRTANPSTFNSQRFRLPRRRIPAQYLVVLHRFEREQGRQCRVVSDFQRRIGLSVLRLQFVEEVTGVRVQRVVLFDAAARVDIYVRLDRLPATAAAAAKSSASA